MSLIQPSLTAFSIPLHALIILLIGYAGLPDIAYSQNNLQYYNKNTQVRKISFRFRTDDPIFAPDELQEQLVTEAPTFWNRLDRFNPFKQSRTFPFDPIELQKDVVRLREYYKRNGFPDPRISYSASYLDTTTNKIHIRLAIREGDPLFINDIRFLNPDSTTTYSPKDNVRNWNDFIQSFERVRGTRYTEVERIRIQDQLFSWFQNYGYAFVNIDLTADIDTTRRAVDLNAYINTGPVGFISSINIEGNQTVSENILLRELPFKIGDRYSSKELREGQQELFGLNLFRVALADLPQQPADSTVDVRIRVNEAKRRYITAETGYSLQEGIGFEGEWSNRNFFGSARNLSINFVAQTGILGSTGGFNAENAIGKLPARLFRTTVSLKQPYLFTYKLSGIFSPFIEFQNDPQLAASNDFLDINRRELGFGTTFIYEALPFRPVSVQYSFSRLLSRSTGNPLARTSGNVASDSLSRDLFTDLLSRDLYNKSSFGVSATIGKADNYIRPGRGLLVKPFFETAGLLFTSGLEYDKIGVEVVNYHPLSRRLTLSTRLFYGNLWTRGRSKDALDGRSCSLEDQIDLTLPDALRCLVYENRFDPVFFYAGGGSDVRGWTFQLLGPKVARADPIIENDVVVGFENFVYERVGGTTKLIGNIELRRPIPGFSSEWEGAAFFDFGQISNDRIRFEDFHYAIGGGIRYNTFIGVIRADLALKLNPSDADLFTPEDAFLLRAGSLSETPDKRFFRRFGLHLSIGQAF